MPLEQLLELLDGEPRFVKNLTKGTGTNTAMIRNNYARNRIFPPKDHVAALLPLKYETNPFQSLPKIPS